MIILDAQTGFTHLKWDIHTKKRTKKKLQEQVQITAPDLDKRYVSVYHALRGLPRKLTVMSVCATSRFALLPDNVKQGIGWAIREEEIPGNLP